MTIPSPSSSRPDPHSWTTFAAAGDDLSRDFWGDDAGWTSTASPEPARRDRAAARRGVGGAISRWWSPAATGSVAVTRVHAPVAHQTPGDRDIAIASGLDDDDDSLDSLDDDTDWDDGWTDIPVTPPRSGVDPLLARLGGLAVIVTLLVPIGMWFRSDHAGAVRSAADASTPAALNTDATVGSEVPGTAALVAGAVSLAPAATTSQADSSTAETTPTTEASTTEASTTEAPTTVRTPVVEALSAPACGLSYAVVAGDFWIRIAEGSGVSLDELLAVNEASDSTPLYPGGSICLPVGAERPVPPPAPNTQAPTTTAPARKSVSTSPATASTPTSNANSLARSPTTTAPTPPPPAPAASPAEVEVVIRSVWPDDLEGHAIEIAKRESNLRPNVNNYCCYGLFQVYWEVHQSWLRGLGVTSADQLFDPATNARVALALYQRSGSWAPWGG